MPKSSSTKKSRQRVTDENQFAKAILDFIIEETEAESKPAKEKDPLAAALGRRGGLKGGKARADKLSATKRKAIAKKAAKARWDKGTT